MRLRERTLALLSLLTTSVIVASALLARQAQVAWPQAPTGYVALIKVEGALTYWPSQLTLFGSTTDVEQLMRIVEEVAEDPYAKAAILCINSPGGSAVAAEALYLKVRELASVKPVVAFIEELGTSGAYMVALPARVVVAANSSLTGSVGVYMSVITYGELLNKLGIKVHIFKSGRLKDVGSPYREPSGEEARVLQGIVDEVFELFKKRVLMHRHLVNASEVFSGRPFTAAEALKVGLIDRVGTLDEALSIAKRLAGLPESAPARVFKPPRPGLLQLLLGAYGEARPLVPSYEVLAMWPPPAP